MCGIRTVGVREYTSGRRRETTNTNTYHLSPLKQLSLYVWKGRDRESRYGNEDRIGGLPISTQIASVA